MTQTSKTVALRDNGENKVFTVPRAMPIDELRVLVKGEIPLANPILMLVEKE